jgi:predicted component of type VI protein secretion system
MSLIIKHGEFKPIPINYVFTCTKCHGVVALNREECAAPWNDILTTTCPSCDNILYTNVRN